MSKSSPSSNSSKTQKNTRQSGVNRVRLAVVATGVAAAIGLTVPAMTSSSVTALAAANAQAFKYSPTGLADLVDEVKPAVVSIVVEGSNNSQTSRNRGVPKIPGLPKGHPFNDFFDKFGQAPKGEGGERRRPRSMAQGSGFFISADGYVVSNNHVVDDASKIRIVTHDGKKYDAELIGTDPKTDLALLKVKADVSFKFVNFAERDARVGDWVVAVGNPFGLGGTVTSGIISARGREIGSGPYDDYLQIDAAINRGNSGGPAFNLNGSVVGVNTAIFSPSGGNVGIGFAIPSNIVEQVIADLKDDGKVTRGWLGVQIQPVTEDIADSLDLASADGAMVTLVTEDSPAERAGLKVGDTILELNGKTVKNPRDLAKKVAKIDPGSKADVLVLRNGRKQTQSVKIGTLPGAAKLASSSPSKPKKSKVASLGLTLTTTDAGDGGGVVIAEVDPDGPAGRKGIRRGDQILEIGGKPVSTPRDVRQRLDTIEGEGRKKALFLIKSGNDQRFIALPIKVA